jgi:hypothetical protein
MEIAPVLITSAGPMTWLAHFDFHGAATVADSNFYKSFIERTPGTYNYPASAPNDNDDLSKDGSVIESTVAAFLYDLTDPKNESHDNLDFPGR